MIFNIAQHYSYVKLLNSRFYENFHHRKSHAVVNFVWYDSSSNKTIEIKDWNYIAIASSTLTG